MVAWGAWMYCKTSHIQSTCGGADCSLTYLLLCFPQADGAVPHALNKATLVVVFLAPGIHIIQHRLWVVDGNVGSLQFGQHSTVEWFFFYAARTGSGWMARAPAK